MQTNVKNRPPFLGLAEEHVSTRHVSLFVLVSSVAATGWPQGTPHNMVFSAQPHHLIANACIFDADGAGLGRAKKACHKIVSEEEARPRNTKNYARAHLKYFSMAFNPDASPLKRLHLTSVNRVCYVIRICQRVCCSSFLGNRVCPRKNKPFEILNL